MRNAGLFGTEAGGCGGLWHSFARKRRQDGEAPLVWAVGSVGTKENGRRFERCIGNIY